MCNKVKTKYQIAKEEADLVDSQIIETLQRGWNFRVEAGAGAGKTYSLNKVIEWLQDNKCKEYSSKNQKVICITYTNAAVDVILQRLRDNSFIIPSTIHSFAWNAIRQYQSTLIKIINETEYFNCDGYNGDNVSSVLYTLGHRYVERQILYLAHDDVIRLFCLLLDNEKFRKVFSKKYPLILIDEYQDSFAQIIDQFIKYFISRGQGPQFGFFGDSWQTIYQSQKACGLIEHENIIEIKKKSNFRSAQKIVNLLNKIRPELPQIAADESCGEAIVITCNDYNGARRSDRYFKDDLPVEVFRDRLNVLTRHIKEKYNLEKESLKHLMITHKILAAQQGYETLLEFLGDSLKDKEDPLLVFFMNTVEPIYKALQTKDTQLLFQTLGIKRYPIVKKLDKIKWKQLEIQLIQMRPKKAIDVLKVVVDSQLVPIPQSVGEIYKQYYQCPTSNYNETTIKAILDIEYNQFLSAIDFFYPEAEFSTEHGVKGEEYDNIVFVISKGWVNYQFEKYAPMIFNGYPADKEASYVRNRNLFYVCCSRPKKRLFIFVTIPVDDEFQSFLEKLVGKDNVHEFNEYLQM